MNEKTENIIMNTILIITTIVFVLFILSIIIL